MTDLKYRGLVALGVVLFLTVAIGAVSMAQQIGPQIDIRAGQMAPGAPVDLTISGFVAGEQVDIRLTLASNAARIAPLGQYVAAEDGTFDAHVVLPEGWPDGSPLSADDALLLQAISADGTTMATAALNSTLPETP